MIFPLRPLNTVLILQHTDRYDKIVLKIWKICIKAGGIFYNLSRVN